MSDDVVADLKRDYVLKLAKAGHRYDGRGFDEYRPISVEPGVISRAEGSARVRLGDTEVYCGVKMSIGTPYPDSPASGVMTTSAELVPLASPDFEVGPPRPPSIELARVVDRGIRETDTIDMAQLCVEPGAKVWMTFIDIHVVDYDGNLFDAASLAAMTALVTAKVPYAHFKLGEDKPMPIRHVPITTTAIKLGSSLAFDPGLLEEKVGGPRLTVTHDEAGLIRAMQKGLPGGFTMDEIRSIIATSKHRARDIRAVLRKSVGEVPAFEGIKT